MIWYLERSMMTLYSRLEAITAGSVKKKLNLNGVVVSTPPANREASVLLLPFDNNLNVTETLAEMAGQKK
jgi:hypothetical protein